MGRWTAQPIYIWFRDKYGTGEENCLPYNPDHFYVHIAGNNEEIDMLSGPVTIQKKPKLVQYDTISSFFAHPDIYRYMRSKDGYDWTPAKWESFFKSAMDNKKVLELTVTGKNWVDEVTVEDFTYGPKAGVEKDSQFTLQIKQYRKPNIKKESIVIERNYPPSNTGSQNNINPKKTLNSKLWLIGNIYKNNNGNMLSNIFTLANGKTAYFYYMPIQVVNKGEIRNASLHFTELSNKLEKEIIEQKTALESGKVGIVSFMHFKSALNNIRELNEDIPDILTLVNKFYQYKYGSQISNDKMFDYRLFLKMLLRRDDRANVTIWMKNGMVKDSLDREAIIIANKSEFSAIINNLKKVYVDLNAPSEKVLQVKFLEDVLSESIYDPINNKFNEDIIIKSNDETFWVMESETTEENNPYKEFKLQWSK